MRPIAHCFPISHPTPHIIKLDSRLLQNLNPVIAALTQQSLSTTRRDSFVGSLWSTIMSATAGNPMAGLAYITAHYNRSTPATYVRTVMKLHPHLRHIPEVRLAMKTIESAKNSTTLHKAVPALPEMVLQLIGDLSTPFQITVFQLWCSASRLHDLTLVEFTYYEQLRVVRLRFTAPHKCDLKMERKVAKFIPCPSLETAKKLWTRQQVSYDGFYRFLQQSRFPHLTAHSFRDGSIAYLNKFFSREVIAMLSGHTPPGVNRGVVTYCPPEPSAAESSLCIRLSSQLLHAIQFTDHTCLRPRKPLTETSGVTWQDLMQEPKH
jgi:hypothetical protein